MSGRHSQLRAVALPGAALVLGAGLLMAAACAGGAGPASRTAPRAAAERSAPGPVPVLAQHSHAQCPLGGTDARTLWLRDRADWQAVFAFDEAAGTGRLVDWGREGVLVHALAQQPTLGYGASAVSAERTADGAVEVALRLRRPAPDAMVGMTLSRPCVLVVLPALDGVELRVRDEFDRRPLGTARAPVAEDRVATPALEVLPLDAPPPASR